MYEGVIEAVRRDLQRQFPRWQIEFVYNGTGILQQRIASERTSGRLGADILMVADPAYSLELREAGMLHSFRSREAANLAFDHDPGGFWYPVRISNMVLAYNPLRNARNTVPNSFRDFANDTRAAGAISMRNPLVSGTTMATVSALRDLYGNEYFESLGRQRVIVDYGSEETLRRLETGECRVVMILEESVLKARQEGSRLEIIYPTDGTIVIPSNIMVINNQWSANRNAAAAVAIAEWFLSIEGQNAIVDGWMHSVRRDFPRIPHGSVPIEEILNNSIPVSWENIFRQRRDIQARFEEYILARR
jgi:iron(III) transport system substrate-binding protein